jgi:lipopolysaccharide assembly protein B
VPGLLAFVLGGALLALVGWAAWTLSQGSAPHPTVPDTPYHRGLNALLAGDRDSALTYFAECVQTDSDNIDAYIHLGNLLREKGEHERALHVHRELTVRPGLAAGQTRAVREGLVLDLIAVGRTDEAVEEARELRELDRRNGAAMKLLLRAHEAAHDWERAFEARSEIARLGGERDPEALARYRCSIGESLLREGKAAEAKRQFKDALRLDRNHPAALLRLGDIYYETDRAERAIVLWKGLASAHPERAHLVLGRLESAYFEKGRFSEMGQAYEEILARNPRDVRTLTALARMHLKKGDTSEANRALNEALEIDPDWLPARLLLVNLHRRRGELTRALDEMEALLRGLGTGETFTCRSCAAITDEYWSRCPTCQAWAPHA